MMVPTIHLNGTSKEELLEQLQNAYTACTDLVSALSRAYPHGRDYYPQGDAAIYKAQDEANDRVRRVRSVQNELTEIAQKIQEENS